jgi:hypothetical protein
MAEEVRVNNGSFLTRYIRPEMIAALSRQSAATNIHDDISYAKTTLKARRSLTT